MKKTDLNTVVSSRVRFLMEREHLTVTAMARSIGLSRSYLSNMLHGFNNFTVSAIFSISEVYDVSSDWLYGRSNSLEFCEYHKGEIVHE